MFMKIFIHESKHREKISRIFSRKNIFTEQNFHENIRFIGTAPSVIQDDCEND